MRIPLFKNVILKVTINKAPELLIGGSYMDADKFWVFTIYLLPIKIEIYSKIIM